MKTLSQSSIFATLILVAFLCAPCALYLGGCSTLQRIQNNVAVQAAETAAISIGGTLATGSPAFAYVAPIAVNGLTALADGSNPTAVSGSNLTADAALIKTTIQAAIPNPTGTVAAASVASLYTTAMATPGVPSTATAANAVIGAIAAGLTTGAANSAATAYISNSLRPDLDAFMRIPVPHLGVPYLAKPAIMDEPRTLRRDEQSISSPV